MNETTKRKNGHSPILIANFFIDLNPPDLTLLKLIKLCYIAHGFTLALLDKPLSNEKAAAWKYGPVFPSLYRSFKQSLEIIAFKKGLENASSLENNDIDFFLNRKGQHENFSEDEKKIMESVCEKYGNRKAWELSAITHSEDSPWDKTMKKSLSEIDDSLIKEHYKAKLKIPKAS